MFFQTPLIDHAADHDEVILFSDRSEVVEKTILVGLRGKDAERALLFPDLIFVENNLVMTKVLELKLLERRNDLLAVVALVKDAERQDKDGIICVDRLHAVVSAFIDINDVFPIVPSFFCVAYHGRFL